MMNAVTASIDIDALQHNFTVVRRHAPTARSSRYSRPMPMQAMGCCRVTPSPRADACGGKGRGGAGAGLCQRHHQAHSGAGRLLQCRGAAAGKTRTANHLACTGSSWHCSSRPVCPPHPKVWLLLDTGMNGSGCAPRAAPPFNQAWLSHCHNVVQPVPSDDAPSASPMSRDTQAPAADRGIQPASAHLPGERAMAS